MNTDVTKMFDENGIGYVVKPHKNPVFTCEDAARERGVRLTQILKCMIGKSTDGKVYVMLIPGNKLLKLKKVRKEAGGVKIDLVPPEELAAEYGVTVGAISPTQFLGIAHFFMDNTVIEEEYIDISSGDPNAGVELRTSDLIDLLSPNICDIISQNEPCQPRSIDIPIDCE